MSGAPIEIVRTMVAPVAAATLFPHVSDLQRYDAWMPLIHDVEADDDAWSVELRARVGPFARSKRLRMVRTTLIENQHVVFERSEADGRDHSMWELRADLDEVDAQTTLTMTMRYDGSLWAGAVLEHVLDEQVRQGSERLAALVSSTPS